MRGEDWEIVPTDLGTAVDKSKPDDPDASERAAELHAAAAGAPPPPEPWGFVISITRSGKHRKRHHGEPQPLTWSDYKDFEVLGSHLLRSEVDSVCRSCFRNESPSDSQADLSGER